ncbi:ComEA family DNA-binding protein [Paraglaciecola aestuariivivens]
MNKLIFVLLLCFGYLTLTSQVVFAEGKKSQVSQMQTASINLNTATLDQLVTLPGVGKRKAAAIIEYRTKNGKFKSVDELTKVKGVGVKMLAKLKGHIKVS